MIGLRTRIAGTAVATTAAALLAVLLLVGPAVRRESIAESRDEQTATALVARALRRLAAPSPTR